MPKPMMETLKKVCPRILPVPPTPLVHPSLAAHVDLQVFPVDPQTVIVHPSFDPRIGDALQRLGVRVIRGETELKATYPGDVPYNITLMGSRYFHKNGATDPVCRRELEARGRQFVSVTQGYTKCSALTVAGGGLITADRKLAQIAGSVGAKALLVESGGILLPGMNTGFIGGCSGVLEEEGLVVFSGDWNTHKNGRDMLIFLEEMGYESLRLGRGPLLDTGSIFFLTV